MKEFTIRIVESLARDVVISASSFEEAKKAVMDKYFDSEIVLDSDDFIEVSFNEE